MATDGLIEMNSNNYDLSLIDLYLPKTDGFQVLAHLQRVRSSTSASVMTGHGSIVSAVEAMKKGVVDYLTKPLAFDQLRIIVKKALDVRRLQDHRASGQPSMIGSTVSPAGVPSVSIMNAPDAFHHALTASSETWYRDAQFRICRDLNARYLRAISIEEKAWASHLTVFW